MPSVLPSSSQPLEHSSMPGTPRARRAAARCARGRRGRARRPGRRRARASAPRVPGPRPGRAAPRPGSRGRARSSSRASTTRGSSGRSRSACRRGRRARPGIALPDANGRVPCGPMVRIAIVFAACALVLAAAGVGLRRAAGPTPSGCPPGTSSAPTSTTASRPSTCAARSAAALKPLPAAAGVVRRRRPGAQGYSMRQTGARPRPLHQRHDLRPEGQGLPVRHDLARRRLHLHVDGRPGCAAGTARATASSSAATTGVRVLVRRTRRGRGPSGGAVVPASGARPALRGAARSPPAPARASSRRACAPCGAGSSRR